MNPHAGATPRRLRALAAYGAAVAISIGAAIPLLELGHADLRVPFDYAGDALLYSNAIKSAIDHGWFWNNPSVGVPGGLQLYDYPNVAHEDLHIFLIKAMSVFSHDWALLLNLYFLLGFPLITVTAMATFRRCGVRYGPAIVGGVLYSFLPARLFKGEAHIFLDVFFQVPLLVLLLLRVCGDDPPLAPGPRDLPASEPERRSRRRRTVAALAICALSVTTSAYYSFFTICLLVAGGLWASIERRSARNVISGSSLAAVVLAGMAINGLPPIVYHLRHGTNAEVAQREVYEAEVYGLKLTQLLLPVDGHRVTALRTLKQKYNAVAPLNNENRFASLGVVGGLGFLALIGAALSRRRAAREGVVPALAALNLFAVLIGTIGGLGALFALLVSPQIRGYSRIIVFIGFFALFAVTLFLDWLQRRRPRIGLAVLPVVLVLGLLDQASPEAVRPYGRHKRTFNSDRELVHRIEARVPPGAAVFVLPYVSFPESPEVHTLSANDQFVGYLHGTTTRWSLPIMRGRNGDLFVREVAALPPADMLHTLAITGFDGVLIHRDGYADNGAAIEDGLRAVLGSEPLLSQDARLAFFDLAAYRARTPADRSPAEIARLLHPIAPTFGDGFSGLEHRADHSFRWCGSKGELHLNNDLDETRRMSLKAVLMAANWPARITIESDLFSMRVRLDAPLTIERELLVSPGHHVIRFRSNGRPADAPDDPRSMVWRMEDFVLAESPAAPPGTP